MDKRKAIKLLEEQKLILIEKSYKDLSTWKSKTGSYLIRFFGFKSNEYFGFVKIDFGTPNKERLETAVIEFIDNCIDLIKKVGVVNQNQNILSNINNISLLGIAFSVLLFGFGIGYWVREYEVFVRSDTPTSNVTAVSDTIQITDSSRYAHCNENN